MGGASLHVMDASETCLKMLYVQKTLAPLRRLSMPQCCNPQNQLHRIHASDKHAIGATAINFGARFGIARLYFQDCVTPQQPPKAV